MANWLELRSFKKLVSSFFFFNQVPPVWGASVGTWNEEEEKDGPENIAGELERGRFYFVLP